jgi:hypothetical protein
MPLLSPLLLLLPFRYLMRDQYDAQLANLIASSPRVDVAQARASSNSGGAVVVLTDRGR